MTKLSKPKQADEWLAQHEARIVALQKKYMSVGACGKNEFRNYGKKHGAELLLDRVPCLSIRHAAMLIGVPESTLRARLREGNGKARINGHNLVRKSKPVTRNRRRVA